MSSLNLTGLSVSTDKSLLDINMIVDFLLQTHWHKDTPAEKIKQSIDHSLCFGLYNNGVQIGFARVVTDYTFTAWIADVFILPDSQGRGYGQFLVNIILTDPLLKDVKKWRLSTLDAHSFYAKLGFAKVSSPKAVNALKKSFAKLRLGWC